MPDRGAIAISGDGTKSGAAWARATGSMWPAISSLFPIVVASVVASRTYAAVKVVLKGRVNRIKVPRV